MTKYIDKEEADFFENINYEKFKTVPNFEKRKTELSRFAKKTKEIKKPISIRLYKSDIEKIKEKSEKEWIPYQTLISSIIHKYANNNLINKI